MRTVQSTTVVVLVAREREVRDTRAAVIRAVQYCSQSSAESARACVGEKGAAFCRLETTVDRSWPRWASRVPVLRPRRLLWHPLHHGKRLS